MTEKRHDSQNPDEVSVTEVSDAVLKELSDLFGAQAPVEQESDLSAADVTPTQPTITIEAEMPADSGAIGIVHSLPDDEDVVVLIDDMVHASSPLDPLLQVGATRAEVVSGRDDAGTVVIVDEEVDRVVIVDDDRPDPTFEERQRRHARRERLRKVKWVKVALSAVVVIFVVLGVLASPLFAIRTVIFDGVVYTSKESVSSARNALAGESLFTVDTGAAREALMADPWVADVRVTTHFPGKAIVEISERTPIVWYVGDDQKARIVDGRGHVIAVLDGWPTKYLQVRGLGPSLTAGAVADDVYRAAAQLVIALPDEIRPKVKFLELTAGGELSMVLTGGTLIRFGPPNGLQDKLVAVVVLLRRQNPSTLAVIDVSTGEPTVQTR